MSKLLIMLFAFVLCADEIPVPVGNGTILIQDAGFIRVNEYGSYVPELSFTIANHTSSGWNTLKIQFDMSGICKGDPRQWSRSVIIALGWTRGKDIAKQYKDTIIPLVGKVDGCRTETIKASIVAAQKAGVAEAEEQARIDEAAAERQARFAAEHKRRVEAEALDAKYRARIRDGCAALYQNTSDKRVGDLTVKEEQQVRASQVLGLYSPR